MSDRKYRQRGYQDEGGRGERRGARPQGPPERKEGPRGRGLGAPTESVFRCPSCNTLALAPGGEDFAAVCRKCGAALHACIACAHFDPQATFECRQPIPERVPKKRAANECALFTAKTQVEFSRGEGLNPDDARAMFNKLFDL
jgi:hypothetical protein